MMEQWIYAIGLSRKRFRAMRRAADAARDAKDWPGAVSGYRSYLLARPRTWPIWVQLGHALKELGDIAAAEAAYARAAKGAPKDPDAQLQWGRVLRLLGRFEEARAALKQSALLQPGGQAAVELAALETAPKQKVQAAVSVHRDAGDDARDARQWLAAAGHYRKHLEAFPTDSAIWVQLGNMLKEGNDLPLAEAAYLQAVRLDPKSADGFLQLGHVLKLAGARGAAIKAYQESEAIEGPGAASLELATMGVLRVRGPGTIAAGKDAPATKADKQRIVKMQWKTLLDAQAARDERQWNRSASLYRTYLTTASDAGSVWAELSFVLREAGRHHEAFEALQQAARLLPRDDLALRDQAVLLRAMGKPEEAAFLTMRSMLEATKSRGSAR